MSLNELLEREDERAAIAAVLRSAEAGGGGAALVEGPAGIGKTELLRGAASDAERRGFRVFSARGSEVERDFPFGVVHQLFDLLAREPGTGQIFHGTAELARALLAEGRGGEPSGLLHALYWLVANLADEHPVALVVDDIHWGDDLSLRFLAFLMPRLPEIRVALLLGERSGERDLIDIHAQADLGRVEPPALSVAAAKALLEGALEQEVDQVFAATCHSVTGGNPFFLAELARTVRAEAIEPAAERASEVEGLGPDAVARAILIRLGRISADAVALARAVAVLGDDAELRHAEALAQLDNERAAEAAGRLARAAILDDARPLRFIHPVVRSAVYRDLTAAERATWHRRAASALRAAGASIDRVALHLAESEPAGDRATVEILIEAARRASGQGALDVCIRYVERAHEEPPGEDQVGEVAESMGHIRLRKWDLEGAMEWADRALTYDLRAGVRGDAISQAIIPRALLGRVPEAIEVIEGMRKRYPAEPSCAFEANFAVVQVAAPGRHPELDERIEQYAGVRGENMWEQVLLGAVAFKRLRDGRPAAEIAPLAARAAGREHVEMGASGMGFGLMLTVLHAIDDLDRAEELSAAAAEQQRHWPAAHAFQRGLSARVAALRGDLVRAASLLDGIFDLIEGQTFALPVFLGWWIDVSVDRGDLAEAELLLDRFAIADEPPPMPRLEVVLFARAKLHAAAGRKVEAIADLRRVETALAAYGGHRLLYLPWRPMLVHLLAASEPDEAERLAREELELARNFGTPRTIGVALRTCGLLRGSESLLRESVEMLEESPAALELARALGDLGAAVRRAGKRGDARPTLERALELAHTCGATPLEDTVRTELLATGARPRRIMRSGRDSLTPSELRIAEHAAGGMSNPEIAEALFITRKTVEKHLGSAYAKLAISSRDGLAAALDTKQ